MYDDGAIREIVIWQVPKDERNWPHGLKSRCHYQHTDGEQWVRYDIGAGRETTDI